MFNKILIIVHLGYLQLNYYIVIISSYKFCPSGSLQFIACSYCCENLYIICGMLLSYILNRFLFCLVLFVSQALVYVQFCRLIGFLYSRFNFLLIINVSLVMRYVNSFTLSKLYLSFVTFYPILSLACVLEVYI